MSNKSYINKMKLKTLSYFAATLSVLIFSQCNSQRYARYQNRAYTKVHHNIEKSGDFKKYNKYQKDFLILTHIVKDEYPNYQEYISESDWQKSVNSGLANLTNANDTSAILEYQRFLAQLKNNHTLVVYPLIYNMSDKVFLLSVFHLDNKWKIFDTHKDYSPDLIKTELLAINDIPIDTFFSKMKPYLGEESEEMMYNKASYNILFGRPALLNQIGLAYKSNPDSMKLTVKDSVQIVKSYMIHAIKYKGGVKWSDKGYGTRQTIVKTDSGYIYRFYPEYKLAYLQINTFLDKKSFTKGIKSEVPVIFWPFAFNMLRNAYKGKPSGRLANVKPGTENMTKFYEDFFAKLKTTDCENLIIDVRNNSGGDIFYTYQLISFLTNNTDIKYFTRYIKYTDFYKLTNDNKKIKQNLLSLEKTKINFDTLLNITSLEDDYKVFEKMNNPEFEYYVNNTNKKFSGKVYVLTSPNSASAATAFPVLIQDNKIGAIVGRSPANRTAKQSSFIKFKLPNTSIVISMSSIYFLRPDVSNTNEILIPDYPVPLEMSTEDYTFKYVLKLIEDENNKKTNK